MSVYGYGWRLLTLLKKNKISPKDLAEKVGMTQQGLRLALKKETLKLGAYHDLCAALGYSVAEMNRILLEIDEDEYNLLVLRKDPVKYVREVRETLQNQQKQQ